MKAAAQTLGHIIELAGSAFDERFMDFEVPAAIELLQSERQENGRYAGVLLLRALAKNNSSLFHQHIALVFDKLLIPLRDPRVTIREAAAELLAACLDIVTQRERQARMDFLLKILGDAQQGLKQNTAEVIHGSLLTYRELLLHGDMFMRDTYFDTAETILKFKAHRDPLVRKTVIALIPTLAIYDTQSFSEHFMHKAMAHLLEQLQKPSERTSALIAIGQVARAVGSDMKAFLEPVMEQITQGLQMRGKKNAPPEEPMFQCIEMLASAVGPNLTKLLHDQLDLMFSYRLSEPLRQALEAIAKYIPPLLRTIQGKLIVTLVMRQFTYHTPA